MRTDELSADRNYLDLTPKERVAIATGACKNPYDGVRVPLRARNGQIQRHVPLRNQSLVSEVLTAAIVPIARTFVDATVQEAFRYGAKWWEQRKYRSSDVARGPTGNEVTAHHRDGGARSTSEEPEPGHPGAEIIDLRTAREGRALAG